MHVLSEPCEEECKSDTAASCVDAITSEKYEGSCDVL